MESKKYKPSLSNEEIRASVKKHLEHLYTQNLNPGIIYQEAFQAIDDFLMDRTGFQMNYQQFYFDAMDWIIDMAQVKRLAWERALEQLKNHETH